VSEVNSISTFENSESLDVSDRKYVT